MGVGVTIVFYSDMIFLPLLMFEMLCSCKGTGGDGLPPFYRIECIPWLSMGSGFLKPPPLRVRDLLATCMLESCDSGHGSWLHPMLLTYPISQMLIRNPLTVSENLMELLTVDIRRPWMFYGEGEVYR